MLNSQQAKVWQASSLGQGTYSFEGVGIPETLATGGRQKGGWLAVKVWCKPARWTRSNPC
jgi:hypothetical protein